MMWSHDEQKQVNDGYVEIARVRCPHCGAPNRKYVKSHYTGGNSCVLLAKYCNYCNGSLER